MLRKDKADSLHSSCITTKYFMVTNKVIYGPNLNAYSQRFSSNLHLYARSHHSQIHSHLRDTPAHLLAYLHEAYCRSARRKAGLRAWPWPSVTGQKSVQCLQHTSYSPSSAPTKININNVFLKNSLFCLLQASHFKHWINMAAVALSAAQFSNSKVRE